MKLKAPKTWDVLEAQWLFFTAIVLAYLIFYTRQGLETNDTGWLLGLAYQIFRGGQLYRDITYIRPPVSPLLHSFVYYYPFSEAAVFVDRVFCYFEIAVYCFLSALLAARAFSWSQRLTGITASIGFIFSVHTFPPMAWHTIDGIFFAVISLFALVLGIENKNFFWLLTSALFSFFAAGSKQPFYLIPLLIMFLALVLGDRRTTVIVGASLIGVLTIITAALSASGMLQPLVAATTSQTTLNDLLTAGLKSYSQVFKSSKSLLTAWPILISLGALARGKHHKYVLYVVIGFLFLGLLNVGKTYYLQTSSLPPPDLFKVIFVSTAVYTVLMFEKTRDVIWVLFLGMHAIAWAASISWGYQTPALYSAPSAIVLAQIFNVSRHQNYISQNTLRLLWLILPLSLGVFALGNRYLYSLEGPTQRHEANVEMDDLGKPLNFILATQKQSSIYNELLALNARFISKSYAVLPNIPLASMLTQKRNLVGVDWALNAELGNDFEKIRNRLEANVEYVFLHKDAILDKAVDGKFGSKLTIHVMEKWLQTEDSLNFSIYKNPNFVSSKRQEL